MPVASNPLLQPTPASQTSAASSLLSSKAQDVAPSGTDSFASVYAKQSQADYIQKTDAAQAYADKLANANANKPSFADPAKPMVADSGNDLPAKAKVSSNDSDKVGSKDDGSKQKVDSNDAKGGTAKADDAGKSDKTDKASKADDKDAASDDTAAVADPAPTPADPKADPLLATAPVDPTATAAATPATDPALLAMMPPAAPPLATLPKASDSKAAGDDADGDFDPHADPLADLPALRLALEQNAKAQGTTSAHAADSQQATNGTQQGDDQNAVASLTGLIQQQVASEGKAGSGGDKGLGASATADSVQAAKGAAADASASNFADKLSALTQTTAKAVGSAAATPPASPLQMNQSGWTEGVVNRVMYLSSQNLKSADIQLSPAELGRLDIKVSMTADQQTQVTFLSAHVGVREALEGQQSKLKEMFQQQGLGQMDVNVSDQPRQQNNGQAQEASRGNGSRSGRGEGSGADDDSVGEVAAAVASPSLIGTSAIDYYA